MGVNGFVDLQVNGYRGMDFSRSGLTIDAVAAVARDLALRGTAAFCPTVVTASWDIYDAVLPVLAESAADHRCAGRILGIHLEGPFISPQEGAVGAHPAEFTQRPTVSAFDRLYDLCRGELRIITLAPELDGAPEVISRAVSRGVIVSLGHTLATEDDVRRAVDAGATLSTHLGNGCPSRIDRHRNPIWAQLGSPLTVTLIADGHHLPVSVLASFLMAKAPDRAIFVSDASPVAGLPPGEYDALGGRVRVTPGGRIEGADGKYLAGSSACLIDCANFAAASGCAGEALLWRLCSDNPLAVLGGRVDTSRIPDTPAVRWRENRFTVEG
jgi:N-acetylglucosamine-6-phosphate deacetylase